MERENDREKDRKQDQKQPLFREKSLERISSPEQLQDYMRVTSPRLWMILGAIMALLPGFVVYAATTRMESTVTAKMTAYDFGAIGGTVPDYARGIITENMPVRIGGQTGTVSRISTSSGYLLKLKLDGGSLPDGDYILTLDGQQPDGEGSSLWITCTGGQFFADKTREESALIDRLRRQGDARVRIWPFDAFNIRYDGRRSATVRAAEPRTLTVAMVGTDDPEAVLTAGPHCAEIGDGAAAMNVTVTQYSEVVLIPPEDRPGAVSAGAAIRIDGVTGVIGRITEDAAFELEAADGAAVPEGGEYRVTLSGTDPSQPDTPFLLVTVVDGRIIGALQEANGELLEKLRQGDTAVWFWNEPGEVSFDGGRLATVTGVEDYVSANFTVALDRPDAYLEPGVYEAEIVTEQTTPISFLLN